MYSRLNVAFVALVTTLSVGAVLSMAGPSTAQDEGGTPTSMGLKCQVCKALGCPDTSPDPCTTITVEISAEVAAKIKLILGLTVEVGGTLTWYCYQGSTPCVEDMGESGAS